MHCRIRAFRATTDQEACLKFIEGHRHILETVGVNQVTSSKDEWMYNPASFAIIVESLDKQKVYGGARINVANGITPLPIEEATGYMDNKIYGLPLYLKTGRKPHCHHLWLYWYQVYLLISDVTQEQST